jgi:hypothetical protein
MKSRPPHLRVVEAGDQAERDREVFAVEQEILAFVEAKLEVLNVERERGIDEACEMARVRLRPIDAREARSFTADLARGELP